MRHLCLVVVVAVGMAAVAIEPPDVPRAEPHVPERVAKLIQQLGSEQFKEREEATRALEAIGAPALPALRQAAMSKDLEVRRRAVKLIVAIERRLDTARILQPKRVHLVYKNTPLLEAAKDFGEKTGHSLQIEGDKTKLADRKITLDTGEVTFWEAYERFCKKAGLIERAPVPSDDDDMTTYRTGRGGRVQVVRSWRDVRGVAQHTTTLIEGKTNALATCQAGALRIRALPQKIKDKEAAKAKGKVDESEKRFDLELACDPNMRWQSLIRLKIDKAIDDQGQALEQVPVINADYDSEDSVVIIDATTGRATGRGSSVPVLVPVRLKRTGGKPSKTIKELHGTIAARAEGQPEPIITVDNILKAEGKTVEGPDGSFLKVVEIKAEEDGQYRVLVQLQGPGGQLPFGGPPFRGRGRVIILRESDGDSSGFTMLDAKGKRLVLAGIRGQAGRRFVGPRQFNLVFQLDKDQTEPAKLVFTSRRTVVIEVPFTLKDVTLP
jgi:hypothetical protein